MVKKIALNNNKIISSYSCQKKTFFYYFSKILKQISNELGAEVKKK